MTYYSAEFEDNEIEVLCCSNDNEAIQSAWELETVHGSLMNIFKLDENFDKVKSIY